MSVTPIVRRHLLEPLWNRYTGAGIRETERDLERSQWLSSEALATRQLVRLQKFLAHVDLNNAFYHERFRNAGVTPTDPASLDAFRRIPVLTKAEVRQAGWSLMSRGVELHGLMQAKTGGSTGKPIQLAFSETVSRLRAASGRRRRTWSGWRVGEPVGNVWGNPVKPQTLRNRLSEWLLSPGITLDTMSLTHDAVRAFEREWLSAQPSLLFGHAHSLYVAATMVDRLQLTGIRPRAIIASSMMLVPHERAEIERVFGVKVTDLYGCEEVGVIASQCERHEGLHLNSDQLVVEVLHEDGTPVAPGETGLVVVTDLLNLDMPLIRYRLEDMAETSVHPCPCGRGLPTLRRVVGRTADFLKRADGSQVAGISLIENSLTRLPGIEQMQIVQESLERFVLNVVPNAEFETSKGELLNYFSSEFPGASVGVNVVESIPQEANGKYRFSICKVPN